MAIPKHNTHKHYVRYAEHCLKMVPAATDSGISCRSTRNGGRMAETGGCYYSSAQAKVM